MDLSGVSTGPLQAGERVTLTDSKGRRKSVVLKDGAIWHTTKGAVAHDDLIGGPEGVTVKSVGGMEYLAFRPLLSEYMVSMPRDLNPWTMPRAAPPAPRTTAWPTSRSQPGTWSSRLRRNPVTSEFMPISRPPGHEFP